jgi:hypothetical protein
MRAKYKELQQNKYNHNLTHAELKQELDKLKIAIQQQPTENEI